MPVPFKLVSPDIQTAFSLNGIFHQILIVFQLRQLALLKAMAKRGNLTS